MIIENEKDIRRLIKRAAAAQDLTLAALARRMDRLPQELNNTLAKKFITVADLQTIASALDCKVKIDFIPAAGDQTAQHKE